jgi:hypothetical protein
MLVAFTRSIASSRDHSSKPMRAILLLYTFKIISTSGRRSVSVSCYRSTQPNEIAPQTGTDYCRMAHSGWTEFPVYLRWAHLQLDSHRRIHVLLRSTSVLYLREQLSHIPSRLTISMGPTGGTHTTRIPWQMAWLERKSQCPEGQAKLNLA